MYGDTWQVRWKEFLSDSYVYGSKIEFNEDGSVSYKNRLMPPGTVIHTWYSMTNFQGNRIEPSLPLIDGERAYSIAVNIDYHNSESEALMLRIIFFDRYDVQAQSIIVRDKKAFILEMLRLTVVEIFCRKKTGKKLSFSMLPRTVAGLFCCIPFTSIVCCILLIEIAKRSISGELVVLCLAVIFTIFICNYLVFLMRRCITK